MSSIYIHIPYCHQACYYCNFHFSTTLRTLPEMETALLKEIELRRNYLTTPVESIYFGGGTPSLPAVEFIGKVLDRLHRLFNVNSNAEITLEANPEDIHTEKLHRWKDIGINRLSMGIQSFADADLQWMNRSHTAAQTLESIDLAQDAGFANMTIDLIYGTPTLTDSQWEKNVQTAVELQIPHLSCYALTVEPGTALSKMITLHKKQNTDTEKQARHFELLMQWMHHYGYDHYEVSNFARPGFYSRHNSGYWNGQHYMGIGPSAHSYNGKSRQWNIANNIRYIKALEREELPFEIELLTREQQLDEYIMTGLRTIKGIDLGYIHHNWGKEQSDRIARLADKFLNAGHLVHKGENLVLTDAGFLLADGIAADLFC